MTTRVSGFLQKIKKEILKTHNLFLVASIPAALLLLVVVPTSWGLDEQMHTARVYQISDGVLYPGKLAGEKNYGGYISKNLIDALNNGWSISNQAKREMSFYDPSRKDLKGEQLTKAVNGRSINSESKYYAFGPTGPYSPVVYAPAAVGMKIGRVLDLSVKKSIFLARLGQVSFYIALVYFSLRAVQNLKVRWLLLVVALLPASMYQAVTINADAFTNAAIIAFMALMGSLMLQKRKITLHQEIMLAAVTALIIFTKPSYVLAMALIALIPNRLFKSKRLAYMKKASLLGVGLLLFIIVSIKGAQYSDAIHIYFTSKQAENIDITRQLLYIFSNPMEFSGVLLGSIIDNAREWHFSAIGVMGYNYVVTPYPLIVVASACIGLAMLYVDRFNKYFAVGSAILGLLSALSIIVLLYGTFNMIGSDTIAGVQGRYFIPCLVVAGFGVSRLTGVKVALRPGRDVLLFFTPIAFVLYGAIYAYYLAVY